ncbi:MAG TPA: SPOR domain-containing protein [Burkholderiales bacterium]|nr:SPOR domain-containing protein [Burkholderiales bacterium]
MAESQDVDTLRRRGRRRLVGAIALVLLAIIVLPMVFDRQPKQAVLVNVRIPSEDEGGLSPKVAPQPAAPDSPAFAPTDRAPVAASVPAPAPAPESAKPEPAPQLPSAPKSEAAGSGHAVAKANGAERERAEAARADKEFVVPVAALAEQDKVRLLTARLRAGKLPYYTEAIETKKGKVTRVRVGPFTSHAAAERALEKLEKLGLKPGPVATK